MQTRTPLADENGLQVVPETALTPAGNRVAVAQERAEPGLATRGV